MQPDFDTALTTVAKPPPALVDNSGHWLIYNVDSEIGHQPEVNWGLTNISPFD